MNILILATKDCSHRPILEKQLKDLSINFEVKFVEDNPEAMKKYQIHNSPNLIVNDTIVFRASPTKSLPSDAELKNYVNQ
jgi:glutaredoxin